MDEFRALFDAFSSTINQFPVFVNVGNSHRLRILSLLLRGSRLYKYRWTDSRFRNSRIY